MPTRRETQIERDTKVNKILNEILLLNEKVDKLMEKIYAGENSEGNQKNVKVSSKKS